MEFYQSDEWLRTPSNMHQASFGPHSVFLIMWNCLEKMVKARAFSSLLNCGLFESSFLHAWSVSRKFKYRIYSPRIWLILVSAFQPCPIFPFQLTENSAKFPEGRNGLFYRWQKFVLVWWVWECIGFGENGTLKWDLACALHMSKIRDMAGKYFGVTADRIWTEILCFSIS